MKDEYLTYKCSVCGKRFYAETLHIYRAKGALACSYKCQRKWEREREQRPSERKRREQIKKELAGAYGVTQSI